MTVPDAVEAARKSLANNQWQPWITEEELEERAHAAIEAAMPAIREALAQEIEADEPTDIWEVGEAYERIARIVRGGTP